MGLFGILGSVAKGVLSTVTHGASDKIISGLKSVIGSKPKASAAAVSKALPKTAMTSTLERALGKAPTPTVVRSSRSEGWGYGAPAKPAAKPKPRRRPTLQEYLDQGYDEYEWRADWNVPYPTRRSAKPAKAKSGKRARSPAKARSPRKAPSGGLDLKKIASMWRAEGKPGTWLNYIKAHTDVRKP